MKNKNKNLSKAWDWLVASEADLSTIFDEGGFVIAPQNKSSNELKMGLNERFMLLESKRGKTILVMKKMGILNQITREIVKAQRL